jgi:hypothetical protein
VKFDIVPAGAGLTEHLTQTAKVSGKPGGKFRLGGEGRNVAFFREAVSSGGHIQTGPLTTAFTQAGSYTATRESTVYDQNDQPHKVIEPESSGDCADSKTGHPAVAASFRVRAGKLVGAFELPPYPDLKDCQGVMDRVATVVSTPSGISRSRTRSARTLSFPIRYRKSTRRTEDGATISQVVTWSGTIALVKVKDCPFHRGSNQFGCAGGNPDSL